MSPHFWMSALRLGEEERLVPGGEQQRPDSSHRASPSPSWRCAEQGCLLPTVLTCLSPSKTPGTALSSPEVPKPAERPVGWGGDFLLPEPR